MKKRTPREVALSVLARVEDGQHIQKALSIALEKSALDASGRRLCSDLSYGCLREEIRINYILGKMLKNPRKLPPAMLAAMKLGVYGLIFQDRAPQHAVIYGLVEHVKNRFGSGLAAVANGALRSVQRLGESIKDPAWYAASSSEEDLWRGSCIFYGLPQAVANLWSDAYGRENALALLKRSSRRPWTGMRINACHPDAGNLKRHILGMPRVYAIGEWGFAFPPGEIPEKLLDRAISVWWEKGAFSWQAAGSMAVMRELSIDHWKGPVLDACAGSGGKSALLAEAGAYPELASDISAIRLANLKRDFARLNLAKPRIIRADASKLPLKSWNGHIVADVPCSGLGVLARRPELRKKFKAGAFEQSQNSILECLADLLLPGHELAYITCTLNPRENERLVAAFLDRHPQLKLARQWQTPHGHPWLEGMYGAVLLRH